MLNSPPNTLYRQQLVELYEKYNPDKLETVDDLLQRFAGHEEALIRTVERKYVRNSQQTEFSSSPPTHRGPLPDVPTPQSKDAVEPSLNYSADTESTSHSLSKHVAPTSASSIPAGGEVFADSKNDNNGDISSYHARLTRLYEAHAPLRVSRVDHELEKYKGREEEVIQAAVARFGPEPPAPAITLAIPAMSPNEMDEITVGSSTSPNSSLFLSSSPSNYRSRAAELYLCYDPSTAHKVDAQLSKFKGHEETSLRDLEKLKEGSPVTESKANSLMVGSTSAPLSTTPAVLRTQNNDEGVYAQRLMQVFELYAPEKAHRAAQLLQRYPCREEEVIQAAVEKYGPKSTTGDNRHEAEAHKHSSEENGIFLKSANGGIGGAGEMAEQVVLIAREGEKAEEDKMQKPTAALEARAREDTTAAEIKAPQAQDELDTAPDTTALSLFPSTCSQGVSTPFNDVSTAPPALVMKPAEPPLAAAAVVLKCVSRIPLFNVTVYDFFRVLGTLTVSGKEVVTTRVATTLLHAIDPELPSLLVPPKAPEKQSDNAEEFLSEVEIRDYVLQFCIRETENSPQKKEKRAIQVVHIAVKRMAEFVKTCRCAVLQLQRQPAPLSAGFWVNRAVQPRVIPRWDRCWAKISLEGDALSICAPGSVKTELRIPFSGVVRCYRETRAAGAPPMHSRKGVVFQLTTGNPPLQVVVCPEVPDVSDRLLASVRAWSTSQSSLNQVQGEVLVPSSVNLPSKYLSSQADVASQGVGAMTRVWSLMKGASTYELQSWVVEDDLLRMTSLSTNQVQTCAVAEITAILGETVLPVPPPLRSSCGFVLYLRDGSSILAFTKHAQERAHVLARLHQSQLLLQLATAA